MKQVRKYEVPALVVSMLFVCLLFGRHTAATGTLGTKAVGVDYLITDYDAVAVTKIAVASQPIHPGLSAGARVDKPGTPFQADEDWIKNMSIFVQNRTDKVMVCAELELFFPDTGSGSEGQPVTGYTVTVGQRPDWSLYYRDGTRMTPDPTKKPLAVAPGQTVEVSLAGDIDDLQAAVERTLLFSKVTRVNIARENFYFEGGLRWAPAVGYSAPVLDHPGQYSTLAKTFFPGHPSFPEHLAQKE
jgi:hypothetical protein